MMIMSVKVPKKKGHPKFNVPNYGTKSRSRVKARWRKQRGIDNKKRIKRSHMGAEPTIGYRNPESVRGIRQNGKRAVLVHNIAEFRSALSGEESVDVIVAASLSRRKRLEISKLAAENKVRVVNMGRALKPRPEKAKEKKADEKTKEKPKQKEAKPAAQPAAQAPAQAPAIAPHASVHGAQDAKSEPKGATDGVQS